MNNCFCGNSAAFEQCCEPIINGLIPAQTAEHLMRSRYSAFVVQNEKWLLQSWHPVSRPSRVTFDSAQQWIGLTIKKTIEGGSEHESGEVEFVARFKVNGKAVRLHENSHFERVEGQWMYHHGKHFD